MTIGNENTMPNDLTRYDINNAGEIPLSTGRYVRWEDVEDLLVEHAREVEKLEAQLDGGSYSYQEGYDDGYADAEHEFRED